MIVKKTLFVSLLLSVLTACGGGGGDGSTSSVMTSQLSNLPPSSVASVANVRSASAVSLNNIESSVSKSEASVSNTSASVNFSATSSGGAVPIASTASISAVASISSAAMSSAVISSAAITISSAAISRASLASVSPLSSSAASSAVFQHIEAEEYSAMLGIQIQPTQDLGNGQNIGFTEPGDWLDYNINLAQSGTYRFSFRVSSALPGGQIVLENSNGAVLAQLQIEQTGGWQTWNTLVIPDVKLSAGQQTIRVAISYANLNWFEFSYVSNVVPASVAATSSRPASSRAMSVASSFPASVAMISSSSAAYSSIAIPALSSVAMSKSSLVIASSRSSMAALPSSSAIIKSSARSSIMMSPSSSSSMSKSSALNLVSSMSMSSRLSSVASGLDLDKIAKGKAYYEAQCMSCHGKDGKPASNIYQLFNNDKTLATIKGYTESAMPLTDPGSCKGECSETTSYYIMSLFNPAALTGNTSSAAAVSSSSASSSVVTLAFQNVNSPVRRLTRREINNSLSDLLGQSVQIADKHLPGDAVFEIFPSNITPVVDGLFDRYADFADEASRLVVNKLGNLLACNPAMGESCARTFLETVGLRILRSPLSQEQITHYLAIFNTQTDRVLGIQYMAAALFQSPYFIYHLELGTGTLDPVSKAKPLSSYELAARISFFLWGMAPDTELLTVAKNGWTEQTLRQQADRLLKSPKVRAQLANFHNEWLKLASATSTNNPTPLLSAMNLETEQFVSDIILSNKGFAELMTQTISFPPQALWPIYGINNADASGVNTKRYGLLSQAAFLSGSSGNGKTNPVKRGVLILKNVLCEDLPPPSDANAVAAANATRSTYPTAKAWLNTVVTGRACDGCHQRINPVGLAFESFDASGMSRVLENGNAIDTSGKAVGVVGLTQNFLNSDDLLSVVATLPRAQSCYAKQWLTYSLGYSTRAADAYSLQQLEKAFSDNPTIRELLINIVLSRSFRSASI